MIRAAFLRFVLTASLAVAAPAFAQGTLTLMRGVPSFGSNLQIGGHGETTLDIAGGDDIQVDMLNAPSWITVAEVRPTGPGRVQAVLHADPTEFGRFENIRVRVLASNGRSATTIPFSVQVLPPPPR